MPHAEISEVWPRNGRIQIKGEVIGVPDQAPAADWRLRLVSRERRKAGRPSVPRRVLGKVRAAVGARPTPATLTVPAEVNGTAFEVQIPLGILASRGALPKELWDLHLVADSGARTLALRLGRHLDDMPGKKQIVTFPQQTVDRPVEVSIRPYYTDGDHLAIRCTRRHRKKR